MLVTNREYRQPQAIVANLTGARARFVKVRGREFLIAPATLIVPGVLNGSKGPLYYPPQEIERCCAAWNGKPIVVNHPEIDGEPVSASHPGVTYIGELRETAFNGKLQSEAWFDVAITHRIEPKILENLRAGNPVELSTGLYTTNIPKRGIFNGRPYTHIATNYEPDHLAVFSDKVGACSVADGCGILMNEDRWVTIKGRKVNLGGRKGNKWGKVSDIDHRTAVGTKSWKDRHPSLKIRKLSAFRRAHMVGTHEELSAYAKSLGYAHASDMTTEELIAYSEPRFGLLPDKGKKMTKNSAILTSLYAQRWPQVRRDALPEQDFAGKLQSFPIANQQDVDCALAIAPNELITQNICRIANRKGLQAPPVLVPPRKSKEMGLLRKMWNYIKGTNNEGDCHEKNLPEQGPEHGKQESGAVEANNPKQVKREPKKYPLNKSQGTTGPTGHPGPKGEEPDSSAIRGKAAPDEEEEEKEVVENWEEAQHPRDEMGRFALKDSESADEATHRITRGAARRYSEDALEAAMEGRSEAAAEAHATAASEHEDYAHDRDVERHIRLDHEDAAKAHRVAESRHREVAAKAAKGASTKSNTQNNRTDDALDELEAEFESLLTSNSEGDDSMLKTKKRKLTANEREQVVDFLVTNCECWEEEDREVLNQFSDAKLLALGKQTHTLIGEQGAEGVANEKDGASNADVSGSGAQFEDEGGYGSGLPTSILALMGVDSGRHTDAKGGGKTTANGAATKVLLNEEEEAEPKEMAENEWMATAPQSVKEDIAFARNMRQQQRNQLVSKILTANANCPFSKKELLAKPLGELVKLSKMSPVANQFGEENDAFSQSAPNYMGAAGGGDIALNAAGTDDNDKLELPTMKFDNPADRKKQMA